MEQPPATGKYGVMVYYDTIAPSYRELYGAEQLPKYSTSVRLSRRSRILDLGCGVGLLYEYAVSLGVEVELYVGIDLSFESLRELRARYSREGLAEAVAGDIDRLPIRDGAGVFTNVYSFTVYTCSYSNPEAALRVLDLSSTEEVAISVLCSDGKPRCPQGLSAAGELGRAEVLCKAVRKPGGTVANP